MIYLKFFQLRSEDSEQDFFTDFRRNCYDSYYSFQFFPRMKELSEVTFSDITIFCGSNGSGKSTLLNIIAETLELKRESSFNKTYFFDPVSTNGGQAVADAFMRTYGVDIKKAGALNTVWLDVKQI